MTFEHVLIQRDVTRLALVFELLAKPCGDLDGNFTGIDRRIETFADRHQQLELIEIGFDRRLHVGILQLASKPRSIKRRRTMDLAERSSRCRVMLETFELVFPAGAEFGLHSALDESPPHRRRLALQLHQLAGVFGRQRVGNGGQQLRHLHDRTLEPAERGRQRQGIAGAATLRADQALARDARRYAADLGADAGIAPRAGGEAVFFAVGRS